eukprot:TRINITY_DN4175_c3_g4_i1.p1 TRINITY_DN4175_c3_g4~~TRINITY_DN4175_c3_g4_i1.p1  ORF type:complete len:602 (-),score=64.73 TRINITY_DN4175_c3_g4_i1:13-1794(-)
MALLCRAYYWVLALFCCVLPDSSAVPASTAALSVWFVSWQHTGHLKALCPIATELQTRGWQVRIAVHDEIAHQVPGHLSVEKAGSLPWSWSEELQYRRVLWDPSGSGASEGGASGEDPNEAASRKAEISEKYFEGSQRSIAEGVNASLSKLPRSQWPALLVVDVSTVGVMDLAERLNLPYAVISPWPVGPTLQSIGDPTALAYSWIPSELFALPQSADQQSFGDRLKRYAFSTLLPWFMGLAGFHAPRRAVRDSLGLEGKLELLEVPRWGPRRERPLVVVLSFWGLDRPRPLSPNIALVGPVEDYAARARDRAPLSEDVSSWLAESADSPIIYVSFGTNVQLKPWMIRELVVGMKHLSSDGFQFLWDANESDVAMHSDFGNEQHDVMSELPSNILFAPRVDQLAVLASGRIRAFVSHCGLNSVHEAAHFGVPIIGLPFLGDQLITAHLLVEARAGELLRVPRLAASAFEAALRKVAMNDEYGKAALRLGSLGRYSGGARAAADSLEAVAKHGNAHFQMLVDLRPEAGRLWDVRVALVVSLCACVAFLCCSVLVFSGRSLGAASGEAATQGSTEGSDQTMPSRAESGARRRKKP